MHITFILFRYYVREREREREREAFRTRVCRENDGRKKTRPCKLFSCVLK